MRIIAASLMITCLACSCTPESDPEPAETIEEAPATNPSPSGPPYSRFTIAKQNSILAKIDAGEEITAEEQAFLDANPPEMEEEDSE